jgi:hypothetical protein
MLYFSILLHCIDLTLELLCRLWAISFTILSLRSFIGHYMFWPKWPSADVQVIMGKDSALQWAAESLTTTTCTPEDGQLGQNMQCPIKESKEKIVNDVAHRWHKSSKVSDVDCHIIIRKLLDSVSNVWWESNSPYWKSHWPHRMNLPWGSLLKLWCTIRGF